MELFRQSTITCPFVAPEARYAAADPTANGPRAAVQSARSVTRSRALSVGNLIQAGGSVVMQIDDICALRQVTIEEPTVKREIAFVPKQVAIFPTA